MTTLTMEKNTLFHPKKFIVYLLIVSIVMLFAGLTSAYIVSKGEGLWYVFELPKSFIYSTFCVLASSFLLHMGYLQLKKNESPLLFVLLTIVLGIGFLITQWLAFVEIYNYEFSIVLGGSEATVSGSYLYIISGLHGVHIVGGLIFLLYLMTSILKGKVTSERKVRYEGCMAFWHFLGGLWIYLYVFLIINHS